MKSSAAALFIALSVSFALGQSQTPFSIDSAASYLRTIAVDIGARPMGSANERAAMEFALRKFREFGLSETYIMPISEYSGALSSVPTNIRSGVAVGVLRGATNRIIVLGAHIDSADPSIPGANDDGSGCAAVIELARVLSRRTNQSTIVFALFGGEEAGLKGSRHFVRTFPDTSRIVLMLQLDMANGSSLLIPTIDSQVQSSPEWLVRAAYEEFEKLDYKGLHFPTDFFTLMGAIPGGGAGSDHEPFLEKGIPAIDFTSDVRDPIHTPQDNYENFKIAGLKRSGDLVYKLVERFDNGLPTSGLSHYFLYEVATFPVFVPLWALWLFILLTLTLSGFALVRVRGRRRSYEGAMRPKVPGLKLFLLMLIIQTCAWLSENVVSLVSGVRFPWMTDINAFIALSFIGSCIGIWFSILLSPKLHLRQEGYPYFLRAFIILVLLIALFALSSAKLALYPAIALFMISLSMLVHHRLLRLILWLLSPHFMFRLFFSEGFDFIARLMHVQPDITPGMNTVIHLVYILFFSFWAFPFLLGFAAITFDSDAGAYVAKLRKPIFGIIAVSAFILTAAVLSLREPYSKEWQPTLRIEQNYNLDSLHGTLSVRGSEYLKATHIRFGDRDTLLDGHSTEAVFERVLPLSESRWVSASRSLLASRTDTATRVELSLQLRFQRYPTRVKVSYSGNRVAMSDVVSPYALSVTGRTASCQWGALADTTLTIPMSFVLAGSDSLTLREEIEVHFPGGPQDVAVQAERPVSIVRTSDFRKVTTFKLN